LQFSSEKGHATAMEEKNLLFCTKTVFYKIKSDVHIEFQQNLDCEPYLGMIKAII
jgi:hypothetical protein